MASETITIYGRTFTKEEWMDFVTHLLPELDEAAFNVMWEKYKAGKPEQAPQ